MIPSHVAFVANIANLVARRGHRVTVIDNCLRGDLSDHLDLELIENVVRVPMSPNLSNSPSIAPQFWSMKIEPPAQKLVMEHLGELFLEQCSFLINNFDEFGLGELEHFDFAMHEVFDVCGIAIFEKLKIRKSVILSSAGMRDIVNEALGIGGPVFSSSILSDYGSHVPISGIRRNLQFHSAWRNFFETQSKPLEHLLKSNESFENLLRYSNLMFVNTHEVADCQREWSRRVFEIGGISFKTRKILNSEYIELFSSFSRIVMVSFGTTTPSFLMPNEYKLNLINVFGKFKDVLFIWKYEKEDEFTENYHNVKNVVFRKFLPQVDLLESHRIALFITHGGQNSLLETFHAGVPSLVVPLFGDQHRNAQIARENGLVRVLRKEALENEEVVEEAIKVAIEGDKILHSKLQKVSSILQNAKTVAESLLITTIETTYSSPYPPDFRSSPQLLNSDDVLLILDVFITSALLIFVLFIIKFLF